MYTRCNSPSTTLWSQLKVADMNDPEVNPPCESLITRFSAAKVKKPQIVSLTVEELLFDLIFC